MGCCQWAAKEEEYVIFEETPLNHAENAENSFSDILIDSGRCSRPEYSQISVRISEPGRQKSVSISRATIFEEAFLPNSPLLSQRKSYSKTFVFPEKEGKCCETQDTDRKR